MMNDYGAFVRAICENPEDDGLRLIFADWLDDNGDPDRAEFVRLQIEIEAVRSNGGPHAKCYYSCGVSDCSLPVLRERENRLAGHCEAEWVKPLCVALGHDRQPVPELRWKLSRGFVAEIHLPLAALLSHAKELFESHPIEVVVTDRVPWLFNVWLRESTAGASHPAAILPDAICDRLPAWPEHSRTRQMAISQLSATLVAYARELAGLPTLARLHPELTGN